MILLSVNVNKVATLRNSREGLLPNVVNVARDCLNFGANGITVHPRPDGRHIRRHDVFDLKKLLLEYNQSAPLLREYNIEGYPTNDFLVMVEEVLPEQVTLVPDPPEAITSNAGWKVVEHQKWLAGVCGRLRAAGIRSSIFVDPYDVNPEFCKALGEISPDRVELYTEMFATAFFTAEKSKVTQVYRDAAAFIHQLKIGLNAGHDLSLDNVSFLREQIPLIDEVSIGHALFCEAMYLGLQKTIGNYLELLQG